MKKTIQKNTGIKILSIVLCVFMLITSLPVASVFTGTAAAASVIESGTCGDNVTWEFDDSGTLTISGTGDMGYYGIQLWSSFNEEIKKVVIKDGVTSISYWAFAGCTGLTSITIPDSVTSIGDYAFKECTGVENITVSSKNTVYHSTGNCLIETESKTLITGCKNSVIPVDGSVTSIEDYAFYGCEGLTSIIIPDSVTSIGYYAFNECTGVENITVSSKNTAYHSTGNCLIETESKTLIQGCNNSVIPVDGSVTIIYSGAFAGCTELTSIEIPDSVTSIGNRAFCGCSGLTSISIPNSVTSIGEEEFYKCSKLTSISISNSVTSIGNRAFYGCEGLTSIEIPDSVTSVGDAAFYGCEGLTSIIIPDGVTSIGDSAFHWCNELASVVIPNSVTSIGDYAFYGCEGLTSIVILDSVTSIGDHAFYGCEGLTSIIIPDSVTSIGDYAFSGCTGVENITVSSKNTVYHSTGNCLIETESKTLIQGCNNSVIPVDGSVTSIGGLAFSGCAGLTSITMPNSVTSIGSWAFYGCTGLTSITIPNSVTSIGDCAFRTCSNLVTIIIPDSITSIGDSAFYCCEGLTSIIIPDSVTSIGDYAFAYCHSLTSIEIPDSVTSIGNSAFYACSNLVTIIIPDSVISIGENALYSGRGLYGGEDITVYCVKDSAAYKYVENHSGLTYSLMCKVHTFVSDIKEDETPATCFSDGEYYNVTKCSVCGIYKSKEKVTVKTTGHTDSDKNGICDRCGHSVNGIKLITPIKQEKVINSEIFETEYYSIFKLEGGGYALLCFCYYESGREDTIVVYDEEGKLIKTVTADDFKSIIGYEGKITRINLNIYDCGDTFFVECSVYADGADNEMYLMKTDNFIEYEKFVYPAANSQDVINLQDGTMIKSNGYYVYTAGEIENPYYVEPYEGFIISLPTKGSSLIYYTSKDCIDWEKHTTPETVYPFEAMTSYASFDIIGAGKNGIYIDINADYGNGDTGGIRFQGIYYTEDFENYTLITEGLPEDLRLSYDKPTNSGKFYYTVAQSKLNDDSDPVVHYGNAYTLCEENPAVEYTVYCFDEETKKTSVVFDSKATITGLYDMLSSNYAFFRTTEDGLNIYSFISSADLKIVNECILQFEKKTGAEEDYEPEVVYGISLADEDFCNIFIFCLDDGRIVVMNALGKAYIYDTAMDFSEISAVDVFNKNRLILNCGWNSEIKYVIEFDDIVEGTDVIVDHKFGEADKNGCVYCSECGYCKVTEQKASFTDSENAKLDADETVIATAGITQAELKEAAANGTILDIDGKELSPEKDVGSGMTVVMPDGTKYTVAVAGDGNSDGKITAADARLALRHSVNLDKNPDWFVKACNVDNAGNITAADARLILRASVGLEDAKTFGKKQ